MEQDAARRTAVDRHNHTVEGEGRHSTLVVSFPDTAQTTIAEVGGKGYSLIRMAEAGLPVPPGAVLTTRFFAPWFDEIKASTSWTALADAPRDNWATLCTELKELCPTLKRSPRQQQALEYIRETLAVPGGDSLFAVRSSSPEEDLPAASFAGGYETRLGVRPAELDDAGATLLRLKPRCARARLQKGARLRRSVAAHRRRRATADR